MIRGSLPLVVGDPQNIKTQMCHPLSTTIVQEVNEWKVKTGDRTSIALLQIVKIQLVLKPRNFISVFQNGLAF